LSFWEIAMRASMTANAKGEPCRGLGCMWGDPRGLLGFAALAAMAMKNGGQNKAALDALRLKAGESVVEIGCGPGMGVRAALQRVGPAGFVAGVDQSPTAAHFAAHAAHRAVLQGRALIMRADAADLPFREAMFDKAFAVNSFQFWPDPARALREIARVLAPNGRLVIAQRAAHPDRPTNFAGAAGGMDRITQAAALLKAQGWRMLDERCVPDGGRLVVVCVTAERPA
jgi:ubiquinone/menaquinone biosynthesis C-methylase UbiE